jgi:hypothetical protein
MPAVFALHTAPVLAQRLVQIGASETTWPRPLLDTLPLAGIVVTVDVRHATRDHTLRHMARDTHGPHRLLGSTG